MQTPETSPSTSEPSASPAPPDGLAPFGFLLLGAASLGLAAVWLALRPEMLYGASSAGFAWLYLVVVGFFFSTTFAGFYCLGPEVFQKRLFPRGLPAWHFGVHLLCTLLAFPLAFSGMEGWASQAWLLPYLAPLVIVAPLTVAILGGPARGPGVGFLRAGAFWLMAAFAAVLALAVNQAHPFLKEGHWIFAGFQLLLAGVFLNFILGAVHLSFEKSGRLSPPAGWPALSCVLVNLGLVFGFHAVALGPRELIAGCALVFSAGLLASCLEIWQVMRSRPDGVSASLRLVFTTLFLGVTAVAIGVASLWQPEPLAGAVQGSYVLAVTLGMVGLPVIALFDLLLPRVAALRGREAGGASPALAAQIQIAGFVNSLVGVSVMVPGVWIASEKVVSLGAYFFLMGVIAFLAHLYLVFRAPRPAGRPLPVASTP